VELTDRVAIVTGGARGIGAAIARRLSRDGLKVALLDLDESAAQETADSIIADGGQAVAVGADVTDASAVEAAVERVATTLGPPTVLINNAGLTRDNLLFKMSELDWDSLMAVHLKGAFLAARAVQKHMVEAKWGRIINMSSGSALGNRGQVNYSTAKAGLQGFTRALAVELGKFGVTVNAIAPGFVETDMTMRTAERLGLTFEEFKESMCQLTPIGRVGVPDDIAHIVSFFVDPRSSLVTGQILYAAGGASGGPMS